MKIKDLMKYVKESIEGGILALDDPIRVNNAGEITEIVDLYNGSHELLISETEYH